MAQTEQLSISWDTYQKIICNGLSQMQQRGEFVDMTLAADGHYVKVHQIVLSLISPYIKDLISTAQSAHPIIFLNNISYTTLCDILEYIYTGEVHVSKNHLPDLLSAGKALYIRGLREIDDNQTAYSKPTTKASPSPPKTKSISERLRALKEKKIAAQAKEEKKITSPVPVPMCKIYVEETDEDLAMDIHNATIDVRNSPIDIQDLPVNIQDSPIDVLDESTAVDKTKLDTTATLNNSNNGLGESVVSLTSEDARKNILRSKVQDTVSNQGGLQTIYNRYMYQLRYISRDRRISWRCVNYNKTHCSATIFTNTNDEVTDLTCKHNHPFHDKNILRKVRIGIRVVYSKFQEASIKSELNQKVQYTMSNQGGLQVIHNRFIYHLRYFGKKNRKRLWRCVDYSSNLKCPANICTNENNQVTERSFTHNHGFHDQKILKKVQLGMIYSVFQEAENKTNETKIERRASCSVNVQSESKHIN